MRRQPSTCGAPARGGATYKYKDRTIDNSWVVPYSPYLLLKYQCHLNVEVCVSVESVKYLYKYVYKGPDRSMVALNEKGAGTNEIALYQDARSLGAVEGCWRTFKFDMYSKDPPVVRLPVHLANLQPCRYPAGAERTTVERGAPGTELTAWLEYLSANTTDSRSIDVIYPDFPKSHKYTKKTKQWTLRKQSTGSEIVGRVYTIHPNQGEVFFLRTLLHHVKGSELALADAEPDARAADAYTLDAFKYSGGAKHTSYQEACEARGLLSDDKEWREVLAAAQHASYPVQIRELYLYILRFNEPRNQAKLFEEFWRSMAEDFEKNLRGKFEVDEREPMLRPMVLRELEQRLDSYGETLEQHKLSFTSEERELAARGVEAVAWAREPKVILDEMLCEDERHKMQTEFEARYATLQDSQRLVVDAVSNALDNGVGPRCIFIDAPGGTGKTYCENAMLMRERAKAKGKVAIAVASSGIASILLLLGRTFHSRFKASLKPEKGQTLNITAQTDLAKLVRRAELIIWDEAPMMHRYQLEALDLTLRDLMREELGYETINEMPRFGGKVVVVAGDFRQTLPVLKKASRAQILDAALTRSDLWKYFEVFPLTENMRIQNTTGDDREKLEWFGKWLLDVGNGALDLDEAETIEIPPELCLDAGADAEALVDWVFPNLAERCRQGDKALTWLAERAVLAPLNAQVDEINDKVIAKFPSEAQWVCLSADECAEADDVLKWPKELLNTFEASGLPKHELRLKRHMPVMLLRNLNPRAGLCNGTRLLVLDVLGGGKLLMAKIINSGEHHGHIVFIPRIALYPEEGSFPILWKRRQFPIRPAFAMTINKAQGQTLKCVGVIGECFTHGQLYVAASRVGNPAHLRFAIDRNDEGAFRTRNVVFHDALTAVDRSGDGDATSPEAADYDNEAVPDQDPEVRRSTRVALHQRVDAEARRVGGDGENCACSAGFQCHVRRHSGTGEGLCAGCDDDDDM